MFLFFLLQFFPNVYAALFIIQHLVHFRSKLQLFVETIGTIDKIVSKIIYGRVLFQICFYSFLKFESL